MTRPKRSRELASADSLRDKFSAIGGWLSSLTFAFGLTLRLPRRGLEITFKR